MKKRTSAVLLIFILFICGCTKRIVEKESSASYDKLSSGDVYGIAALSDFDDFDYKGVNWIPYDDYWRGSTLNSDAADLQNAGTKWVRVWFRSDSSLASLDSLVSKCNESGAKILAVYKKSFPRTDLGTPSQQAQDTARLRSMVNRYKNSIHYWEIHNEPNLDGTYWNLGGTETNTADGSAYSNGVKNYVSWLRLANITIKSADPGATIVLGGVSSYKMEPFMYRLTKEHAYDYFDEVAYHPYADDPDKVVGTLVAFKKQMSTWPNSNLPIWITEIGFHVGTASSGHVGVANETIKAAYLQTTYEKMTQNLYWKRPVFWYDLHEQAFGSTYFNFTNKATATSATTYYDAYYTFKNNTHSWSYLQGIGTTITQQFEHLTVETNTDAVANFYDTLASNQNGVKFNSNAIDDSVTFVVPNVPAGTYNIRVGVKKSNSRGTFQLYAYKTGEYTSGSNLGGVQDLYAASDSYTELNIANWTVGSESDKSFRFKVKGKNVVSSDYTLAFDYIKLIPQ